MTTLMRRAGSPFSLKVRTGGGRAVLAGLVNEIGDGYNKYGFSYQDLVMDIAISGPILGVSFNF